MAASFIAIEYGGPVMLYALLCGTAFNFLSETERVAPGIDFSTRTVLRIGVALLGARITVADFAALGWETDALTCTAVVAALLIGWYIGRIFRLDAALAVLTAGSVAICGASAALAISAALPKSRQSDFNTLVTVAGATALSTVAMILYPVLAQVLGFEGRADGVFLGATIHDVAQVVAASYSLPGGAVESATIVKLLRVAMLVPVVAVVSLFFRNREMTGTTKRAGLPSFLVAFGVLVLFNSIGGLTRSSPARSD